MSGVVKGGAYDNGMSEGEYEAMCQENADAEDDLLGSLPDDDPFDLTAYAPGYWRTRDGVEMKVAEMTDSHLDNAIKLFERTGAGDCRKACELREERKKR